MSLTAVLVAVLSNPLGAHAATPVASDFALPFWQGTALGTAGLGHVVDCSTTNAWYAYDACTVDIATTTTGRGCVLEVVTAPAAGAFGTSFPNTMCRVRITGTMWHTETGAGCAFSAALTLSWESGINSTMFAARVPVLAFVTRTSNLSTWLLRLNSHAEFYDGQHAVTFQDTLALRFNRPVDSCPGPDLPNMKANVYDYVPNYSIVGTDGFLRDDILLEV